jgi:hypothetical protein
LTAHATQRQFVYTHRWRVNDLVMWDDRCTMHRGNRVRRSALEARRTARYRLRCGELLRAGRRRDRRRVRKITLAHVTRILHKSVFITFVPGRRSGAAAGSETLLSAASVAPGTLRIADSPVISLLFFCTGLPGTTEASCRLYRLGLQRWS